LIDGLSAGEIADHIGAIVVGDPAIMVRSVGALEKVESGGLSFCVGSRNVALLAECSASVVIVSSEMAPIPDKVLLCHPNPKLGFAHAVRLLFPLKKWDSHVSSLAFVDSDAVVRESQVEPFAVICAGAQVSGARIGAHAYIGEGVIVRPGAYVMPHAVVLDRCVIGEGSQVFPGAVLGADGFGFVSTPDGQVSVPQIGGVEVGENVVVGANSTIDRAALGKTTICDGVKIDNHVHVAHGATIGKHAILAAYAAVSGSAKVGDRAVMAGRSALTEGVTLGEESTMLGMSAAHRDVAPGSVVSGSPSRSAKDWAREDAALKKLPELLRTVRRLEARLRALEKGNDDT
jgi:UDP-3-O-[3-hydroxymyristoyl] glucosamine N-acyltransferase